MGWSYPDWKGTLYPRNSVSSEWLYYYSKVFDYVEVDHTFYHIPELSVVKKWASVTPSNFRFTIKFPRAITHSRRLADVRKNHLANFFYAMSPLSSKNLAFLIQLPPSFKFGEKGQGLKDLKNLSFALDWSSKEYRYAIEFRDNSWFNDQTYQLLRDYNICMVWNQLNNLAAPPISTTDFVYMHLIGDNSSSKRKNQVELLAQGDAASNSLAAKNNKDKVSKRRTDPLSQMQKWAKELLLWTKKQERKSRRNVSTFAVVSINNHYLGYGPSAINVFRRMIGLPVVALNDTKQTTLFDFQCIDIGQQNVTAN